MPDYEVNRFGERRRDRFDHFTEFDDGVFAVNDTASNRFQPAAGWRATTDGLTLAAVTDNFDTNTGGVVFETVSSGSTALSFLQPMLSVFLQEDKSWPDVDFEMRFHFDITSLPTSNFEFLIGLFQNKNPVTTLDNPSGSSGTDRIALGFASNAGEIGSLESYVTTNSELYGQANLNGSPKVKASTLHTFGLETRSRQLRFFFDGQHVVTHDLTNTVANATEYSKARINNGVRYYAGIVQRSTASVKTAPDYALVSGKRSKGLGLGD